MSEPESDAPDDAKQIQFAMDIPKGVDLAKLVELMAYLRSLSTKNNPMRAADAFDMKKDGSGEVTATPFSAHVARARVTDAIKTLFCDPEKTRLDQELAERFPEETWRGIFPLKSVLNILSDALAEQKKEE